MSDASSYYQIIDGKKYKRAILDYAKKATEGQGDGRISMDEAKELFKLIVDGDTYTDVEKDSMEYVRNNFKFTDQSDEWLRKEVRSWAAKKGAATDKKDDK